MNYFINISGHNVGPMTKEQIFAYPVNENTPVCTESGQWAPLFTYPELQSMLASRRAAGMGGVSPQPVASSGKDKVAAGVLALLLGSFGVQYFYLGKVGGGFLTILLSLVTCGLWGAITFVQGILMLTMTQEEFDRKYVYTNSSFPLF